MERDLRDIGLKGDNDGVFTSSKPLFWKWDAGKIYSIMRSLLARSSHDGCDAEKNSLTPCVSVRFSLSIRYESFQQSDYQWQSSFLLLLIPPSDNLLLPCNFSLLRLYDSIWHSAVFISCHPTGSRSSTAPRIVLGGHRNIGEELSCERNAYIS